MYATLRMDHALLREVLEKKLGVDLSEALVAEKGLAVSQACCAAQIDRKTDCQAPIYTTVG